MGHDVEAGRFEGIELTEVAHGLAFPEGPMAMDDGSVLLVEIARGTLTRVHPDGRVDVVAECGGGPNGAAIGPDGAVYVCNNGAYFDYQDHDGLVVPHAGSAGWTRGSIQRVDPATGAVDVLYTECDGRPLLAPNDIVFDDDGGFWFTDHGVHAEGGEGEPSVLYGRADGTDVSGAIWGLDATNGVGLSPDGATLYVAETYRGRLLSWELTGAGAVDAPDDPTVLHDVGGSAMFDSLAVDGDGSVCVATLITGGVSVVAPDGGVEFLPTGDPLTTNVCFGGDDLRTAFITVSGTGRLLRCNWPAPGLALAHRR